jgi:hypothetical protein
MVPLGPRDFGFELSDSLVTTLRGVTGPFPLGPREGQIPEMTAGCTVMGCIQGVGSHQPLTSIVIVFVVSPGAKVSVPVLAMSSLLPVVAVPLTVWNVIVTGWSARR